MYFSLFPTFQEITVNIYRRSYYQKECHLIMHFTNNISIQNAWMYANIIYSMPSMCSTAQHPISLSNDSIRFLSFIFRCNWKQNNVLIDTIYNLTTQIKAKVNKTPTNLPVLCSFRSMEFEILCDRKVACRRMSNSPYQREYTLK